MKVKANSLKKELKLIEIQKNEEEREKGSDDGEEKDDEAIEESDVSIQLQEE